VGVESADRKMALRQIVETVIAAREIIRRRIGILSGSYAELGLPRELKSAAFGSCGVNIDRARRRLGFPQ
jgi:hypothetical protein